MAGNLKIQQVQLGDSGTAANNFVISVPATPDGSVKLSRGVLGATTSDVVVADSGGINALKFSPTQVPSSDVNTLDDYEEGTWTPNQGSGLTVVGTFQSSGNYTKIGRMVTVNARYYPTTSVAVSAGGVMSSNLPFTNGAQDSVGSVASYSSGGGGSCMVIGGTGSTSLLAYPNHAATAALVATITYFV